MNSVLSPPGSGLPVLPDPVFRNRLEAERTRLLELERRCPPEHAGDLGTVLDVLETMMAGLGWQRPPLTAHDLKVLAAAGAL